MNIIRYLAVAVALCAGFGMLPASAQTAATSAPNIVVIMTDDVAPFDISAIHRGVGAVKTPNIDRLAREGLTINDYYAQASCTAGRAAFITGQYPIRTGLTSVGQPGAPLGLKAEDVTLAEMLKARGYATGQFGKSHVGDRNEHLPTVHGFDEFFGILYHLNVMEQFEQPEFPKNPNFPGRPRNVLYTWASDTDDATADPRFGKQVARALTALTGARFESADNKFEGLAAQDDAVELSGQLNALAVALIKIANDLRWMNAGPLAGLGEIELPALQPGSSIMPGKVNPVIPEATVMAAAQVIGHHTAITVAGQTGNFQLNVTLPLIAANLLESIQLLANVSRLLADDCIAGLRVREARVKEALDRNPILVTALNPVIGYEKGAAIAKQAYRQNRPVLEVAREITGLPEKTLKPLLDPAVLAKGGIHGKAGGGGG